MVMKISKAFSMNFAAIEAKGLVGWGSVANTELPNLVEFNEQANTDVSTHMHRPSLAYSIITAIAVGAFALAAPHMALASIKTPEQPDSTSKTLHQDKPQDSQTWLAQTKGDYTLQLATIYGHQKCVDYVGELKKSAYCLESSTVNDRWFVVIGDYANIASANMAKAELGFQDAVVNSLQRIRKTRCEMPSVKRDGLSCGNQSESAFINPERVVASSSKVLPTDLYAAADAPGSGDTDGYDKKDEHKKGGHHEPRLSSEPRPYLTEKELGNRTPPLIEWGGDFLGTGNIREGFILPTGAVWTPQFWVYGSGRSAFQTFERAGADQSSSEWVNRLDLFGNLQLSGTERLLIGFTPLHREDVSGNRFSGEVFSPDDTEGSINRFNARVRTLFFEGDLAEVFPLWDAKDGKRNDIGFTIGRQGVVFQDGMTINDTLDSIGLSKNNIRFEGVPWLVNWRSSIFYAWDEVNRGNNQADEQAELYAWFNQWDTIKSTIDLDLIYVDSDDESDQFVASINFIQRLGKIGSTFRLAHSAALDEESSAAGDGTLLFAELNYSPAYTKDNMYLNMFASFDNYTSAARDPLGGGPLGRVGLLYAASGLGSYPAPLSNSTDDAYGFSAGYQKIDQKNRRQFTLEVGARDSDDGNAQYGLAARFQQALGKRFVLQVDGFVADQEDFDSSYGARLELLFKL